MFTLRIIPYLFCLYVCSISVSAWAQQCNNSRPASTPADKFFINDDGTITELDSGLTWIRCTVGQHWDGNTCIGQAKKLSWKEAFKEEDKINLGEGFAGINNWRLPKLPELATIVERQCSEPRINLELFPATPSASFWTANHKKGNTSQALAMDFSKHGLQIKSQQEKLHVRLVSGRE